MKVLRFNPVLLFVGVLISFGLIACGGDDGDGNGNEVPPEDNEAPVISLTAPVENAVFIRDVNEIQLTGNLSDNQELDTCIVSLSNELKSASLKSTTIDSEGSGDDVVTSIDDPVPFEPNAVGFSLSGKTHSFSNEGVFGTIPYDATEGNYTLHIEVRDASGNSTTEDIVISISAE